MIIVSRYLLSQSTSSWMLQQPYICLWVLYDGRESRVKLLLIAIGPYSVILDACVVITALIKRPENSFQLTVGRWKFNIFSVSKVYEQNGLTASTKLRLRGHLKMVFIEKSPISGPPPPHLCHSLSQIFPSPSCHRPKSDKEFLGKPSTKMYFRFNMMSSYYYLPHIYLLFRTVKGNKKIDLQFLHGIKQ